MRILTWNIRQGGGSRSAGIAGAIASLEPDICILSEYRCGRGTGMVERLEHHGFPHTVHSDPLPRTNGVLVASRQAIDAVEVAAPSFAPGHWACARIGASGSIVGGIYLPGKKTGKKVDFWEWLVTTADDLAGSPVILAGDLNTGLAGDAEGAPLSCSEHFGELLAAGWRDTFREAHPKEREWSWWGPHKKDGTRNGFRLDHVFLSPGLSATVKRAEYVRQIDGTHLVDPTDRSNRGVLSDHAALVVELEL